MTPSCYRLRYLTEVSPFISICNSKRGLGPKMLQIEIEVGEGPLCLDL